MLPSSKKTQRQGKPRVSQKTYVQCISLLDRQIDRSIDRQIDRQVGRQVDQVDRQIQIQVQIQIQINKQIDKLIEIQIGRQIDRQVDQIDRQVDQIERQADQIDITHVYLRHGCETGLVGWIFPSFPIQASVLAKDSIRQHPIVSYSSTCLLVGGA